MSRPWLTRRRRYFRKCFNLRARFLVSRHTGANIPGQRTRVFQSPSEIFGEPASLISLRKPGSTCFNLRARFLVSRPARAVSPLAQEQSFNLRARFLVSRPRPPAPAPPPQPGFNLRARFLVSRRRRRWPLPCWSKSFNLRARFLVSRLIIGVSQLAVAGNVSISERDFW